MQVSIYTGHKGKPVVQVAGNSKNTAKQIAKGYLEAVEELKKGGLKCR